MTEVLQSVKPILRNGGRCRLDDPMRRITKIAGGCWVRFIRGGKVVSHEQFYISRYGSEARALKQAKIWRNEHEKEMKLAGTLAINWESGYKYYIVGLNWVQVMESRGRFVNDIRAYDGQPKKGLSKMKSFSIKRHGLRGAFDLAVENLQEKRVGGPYPPEVI